MFLLRPEITFFSINRNFSWKIFVISKNIFIFAPESSALEWAGTVYYIDGKRPLAVCRAGLWRTFSKRYLTVSSNLANLNLYAAVMQQRRPRGRLFISLRLIFLLYIIRCTPFEGVICVYIYLWDYWAAPGMTYNHSAWAGFPLLILI